VFYFVIGMPISSSLSPEHSACTWLKACTHNEKSMRIPTFPMLQSTKPFWLRWRHPCKRICIAGQVARMSYFSYEAFCKGLCPAQQLAYFQVSSSKHCLVLTAQADGSHLSWWLMYSEGKWLCNWPSCAGQQACQQREALLVLCFMRKRA